MKFSRRSSSVYPLILSLLLLSGIAPAQIQNAKPNAPPPDEEPIIDPRPRLTKVLLTVVDQSGQPVTSLRYQDLRVLEDGVPQPIEFFAALTDEPFDLVLAIDNSASQERVFPSLKAAAQQFIAASLRPAKDRVSVISFAGSANIKQPLTNELAAIQRALAALTVETPPSYLRGIIVGTSPKLPKGATLPGSTALWDALAAVDQQIFAAPRMAAQRAIILLTDGQDTASQVKMNDAIKRTIKVGGRVYAVGVGDEQSFGVDKDALRKLAAQTGGRAFFPKKLADLPVVFAQIQQELRLQYGLAYTPKNIARDDKYHKLQIEIVNPALRQQKLQLAYPQGYFSLPPP